MSIKQKLNELEEKINHSGGNEMSIIEKIKKQKEEKDVRENESNLITTLKKVVDININTFVEVVLLTCEFVETNINDLKKLFGLEPSGENKLLLMLELLKKLYEHFTEEDEFQAKTLAKVLCSVAKGKTLLNRPKNLVSENVVLEGPKLKRSKSTSHKQQSQRSSFGSCFKRN